MTSHARRTAPLALAVAAAAILAGCGDGTGPAGSGSVQVTMSRAGGSATGNVQVAASLTPPEARAGVVNAAQVASVEVTIERVEVRRVVADTAASDTAGDGGWVALQVEGGSQTVDLVGLPSSDQGVTVASEELDPGDYENVRLFFSEATVTFSEDVTFPGDEAGQGDAGGQTYEAGTAHELFVPSGDRTGLKVPTASFTVDGETGATVNVLADTDASIGNIVVTGRGLLMTPVLTARAEESAGD